MRIAALKELIGEGEVSQPSLKAIVVYQGDRITLAVEFTPHEIATVYAGAFDGSRELEKIKVQPSQDRQTREQDALLQVDWKDP